MDRWKDECTEMCPKNWKCSKAGVQDRGQYIMAQLNGAPFCSYLEEQAGGAQPAPLVEQTILDLGVMSSIPTLNVGHT